MNKPRPTTPADVLDHLDAKLEGSLTLEVQAIDYEADSLLVEDETGKRFLVTVTEAPL